MRKRIVAWMLTLLMIVSMLPGHVFAETGGGAEETAGTVCEICGEEVCVCESQPEVCEICGEEVCVCESQPELCEICGEEVCVCVQIQIPDCSGTPTCWGVENGLPLNNHVDACVRKDFLKTYVTENNAQSIAEIWSYLTETEQTDMIAMVESYTSYADELKALVNWDSGEEEPEDPEKPKPEEPEEPECICGSGEDVQYHATHCPIYLSWVAHYGEELSAEEICRQWTSLDKNTRESILAILSENAPEKLAVLEAILPDMNITLPGESGGIEFRLYGDIPGYVTLVTSEIFSENYHKGIYNYITGAESVLFALDITPQNPDGSCWQPYRGESVTVTLDAVALGLGDGEQVRLLHEHESEIEDLGTCTVQDGKIAFQMDRFSSIYVIPVTTVAVNALDGVVYFDLNAGSVTINGSSYTGYRFDGAATAKTVSGTLKAGESYYVYQSNSANKRSTGLFAVTGENGETDYEMRLPQYAPVTYGGQSWSAYITNNDSTANVIAAWEAASKDGREFTRNYIQITDRVNCTMTIEDLWTKREGGNNVITRGGLNFDMQSNATEGSDFTVELLGDNRMSGIYSARYGSRTSTATNNMRFVEGESGATLTVCSSYDTTDQGGPNRWASAIGANDAPENTGEGTPNLYFTSGTIFAGTTVGEDTCAIGGGGNGAGTVIIDGATVTAVAYSTGATIGGGIGKSVTGGVGRVTITAGEVYAYNYSNYWNDGVIPGAAIGGGSSFASKGNLGDVTITGGKVYAQSVGGVAIGGGSSAKNGGGAANITISGNADVTAISIDGITGMTTASARAGTSIGGGNAGTEGNGGNCTLTISGNPTICTGSIGGGGKNNDTGKIGNAVVIISGGVTQGQVIMAKGATTDCSFTMTGGVIDNADGDEPVDNGNVFTFLQENGGAVYVENGIATLSGGTVKNVSAQNGGAFYITGGTFKMNGGTITGASAAESGGAVCVENGTATVTNGTISNVTAPNGGAAAVNGGTFTMTGGEINSFKASENGGAVCVTGGSAKIGGTLVGSSTETEAQKGGAVYVGGGTFEMIGGSMENCNAGIMGGAVCVEKVGNTSGTATVTDGDISNVTAPNGGAIAVSGGSFTMTGGSISKVLAQSATAQTPDGKGGAVYVLNGTVSVAGGSITGEAASAEAGSGGGVYVEGGSFTMTGGTMMDFNVTGNGGVVCVTGAGASATIQGGTISGNDTVDEAANGGAVYIGGGSFTIAGEGVIQNCNAAQDGGGVYLADGSFSASGGSFEFCSAGVSGGGVYLGSGSLTMEGGGFVDCSAVAYGGGVYLGGGTFELDGDGKFERCSADQNGGGIFIADGTFRMSGGNVASCGAQNGGGVYLAGGAFEMDGGIFETCSASANGGAVCIMQGAADIDGGTIQGDNFVNAKNEITAANALEAVNGGGIYVGGGKLDMSNGTITKCSATSGGAAYITAGECNITGGNVSFNYAQNGGGMYVVNTPVIYGGLNDSSVAWNEAVANGGGMYILQNEGTETKLTTITSGSIDNNTAGANGGGIYHTGDRGECTVSGTSSISGNTAANGGGLYIIGGSTLNVNGGHISLNNAVGMPANSVTTAYDHSANVGVGGGVYVGPGTTVNSSGFVMPEGKSAGIYSNVAAFAADDIYANINATVLSLPNVSNMQLGQNLTATGWYGDYAVKDTAYNRNTLLDSSKFPYFDASVIERYRNAAEYSDTTPFLVESSLESVSGRYICLTIGSDIINFGQIVISKTGSESDDQYFVFEVKANSLENNALELPVFQVAIRGNGSVTIDRVPFGSYTVSEVESWSWRYEVDGNVSQTVQVDNADVPQTLTFHNQLDADVAYDEEQQSTLWLDGNGAGSVNVWNQPKEADGTQTDWSLLSNLFKREEDDG